jgi:hypothetical protein
MKAKTTVLGLMALAGFAVPASAETVATVSIEKVMVGPSASTAGGNNQVWLRVVGQPTNVPTTCMWMSYSLFYVPDDTYISRDRALSMLMTAKTVGQPVTIAFEVGTSTADFLGFGYTYCILRKVVIG